MTRAIALEVLEDLTTQTIAFAYRRIAARHVPPTMFLSNNAPQFYLLHTYLQKTRLEPFTWKFITEQAPWEGATYERLIGIVKSTLNKSLRQHLPTDNIHFQTLIAEIEGVMNDQPLTHVGENTSLAPLTPNDFLKIKLTQENNLPANPEAGVSQAAKILHDSWKLHQLAIAYATKIWRTEYLQFLRERRHTQRFAKVTSPIPPRIGDVVLVHEDNLKKANWPLAVVQELQFSSDKEVRSCVLRLPSGTKIIRPLQKIYPLELNELDQPEPRRIATTKHPLKPVNQDEEDDIIEISVEVQSDSDSSKTSKHK